MKNEMKNEMILSDGTKIKVGDVIEFRVFRTLATVRGFASNDNILVSIHGVDGDVVVKRWAAHFRGH